MALSIGNQQNMLTRAKAFAEQHRSSVRVGAIGVVVLGLAAFFMLHTEGQAPVHQAPVITMVMIQPQKPPPPPPPPPQQKMIVQPKMTVPETKPMVQNQPPKAAPPKAAAPVATPMGTSIHSNAPADAFNLTGDPGGNGLLDGGGGGGGDAWSYYASQAQTQIHDDLLKNPLTRRAAYNINISIWVDSTGTITRVELANSTGSTEIDDAIKNQVLMGMHFSQPPPANMPMPMLSSFSEQRPDQ